MSVICGGLSDGDECDDVREIVSGDGGEEPVQAAVDLVEVVLGQAIGAGYRGRGVLSVPGEQQGAAGAQDAVQFVHAGVLEVGYGPCALIQLLLNHSPASQICGVDPSPDMLRFASRRNLSRSNIHRRWSMPLEAGLRRYADARVAALPPDPPAAFGPGSTA